MEPVLKHTQWYSSTVQDPSQDVVDAPLITRLFRDMRERFPGLNMLNKWVADLLVAHCLMNNPRVEETGKLLPSKVRSQSFLSEDSIWLCSRLCGVFYNYLHLEYFCLIRLAYQIPPSKGTVSTKIGLPLTWTQSATLLKLCFASGRTVVTDRFWDWMIRLN